MSWESPIDAMFSDMEMKLEGEVFRAVQRVGITVDKDELIKALEYDRGQYEKGYADAMATIVHCKDCKYRTFVDWGMGDCVHPKGSKWIAFDYHYCSYGVRREDG